MINEIEDLGKESNMRQCSGSRDMSETSCITPDILFAYLFILAVDVTGVHGAGLRPNSKNFTSNVVGGEGNLTAPDLCHITFLSISLTFCPVGSL